MTKAEILGIVDHYLTEYERHTPPNSQNSSIKELRRTLFTKVDKWVPIPDNTKSTEKPDSWYSM